MAKPGRFCDRGTTLWCRNPLLSSTDFIQGHVIKIEWLATDVTAVGPPDRAKRAIFGVILAWRHVWPIQDIFVVADPLCDVATSSWALISLLKVI